MYCVLTEKNALRSWPHVPYAYYTKEDHDDRQVQLPALLQCGGLFDELFKIVSERKSWLEPKQE